MPLSEKEEKAVWEQIYRRFRFTPSMDRDVIPFRLPKPWAVYDISHLCAEAVGDGAWERLTDGVNRVLLSCMIPGERLVDAFQAAMEREPAFAGFRLKETSQ